MKGFPDDTSQSLVLPDSYRENQGIYLSRIRFTVGHTTLIYICFKNLSNNQHVALEIQGMNHFAFKINGTFANERSGLRDSIKDLK